MLDQILLKKNKLSVLIISNTFSSSYVFRKSLIKTLHKKKKLIGVYSFCNDIESIIFNDIKNYYGILGLLQIIKDILLKKKVVIHSFTHLGNLIGFFISLFTFSKLIINITGMGSTFTINNLKNNLIKKLIFFFYFISQLKASCYIVQNNYEYKMFKNITDKKIFKTVGSGIDKDFFSDLKTIYFSDKIKIGFFSRAIKEKGVHTFYNFAKNFKNNNNFEFIHIGKYGSNQFSKENIFKTAKNNNIYFRPFMLDIKNYIYSCDIIFIPSYYKEGLSRLLIESLCMKKIVICKLTTGVEDIVNENCLKDKLLTFVDDDEIISILNSALNLLKKKSKSRLDCFYLFNSEDTNKIYFQSYSYCIKDKTYEIF